MPRLDYWIVRYGTTYKLTRDKYRTKAEACMDAFGWEQPEMQALRVGGNKNKATRMYNFGYYSTEGHDWV